MFSLQRLLGRPREFFGLLEQSADLGCEAAAALNEMVTHPHTAPSLEVFAEARRKDKEIINRLEETLDLIFVTPFERDDLEDVAQGLYPIPKAIEKFAERYVLHLGQGAGRRFHAGGPHARAGHPPSFGTWCAVRGFSGRADIKW